MTPIVIHTRTVKVTILAALMVLIVAFQYAYDDAKVKLPTSSAANGVTPFMLRLADIGFHPAVDSFLWANTMPEILDLFGGHTEYVGDVAFVNSVDPKMGYPYAFSVLTLPAVPASTFPDGLVDAQEIGQRGLGSADPDWRIPYYMAMNYYLGLKDTKDAIWYFDLAARTPGVPQFAERFALNFSVGTNERQKAEQLWGTIRDSANDDFTKQRAQMYIDHLAALDYLDAASRAYKQKFGSYPTSTGALVAKGIIPSVPADPFGFTFIINGNGTAGFDYTNLPSYILSEPAR